jgi:hypothetical protein
MFIKVEAIFVMIFDTETLGKICHMNMKRYAARDYTWGFLSFSRGVRSLINLSTFLFSAMDLIGNTERYYEIYLHM